MPANRPCITFVLLCAALLASPAPAVAGDAQRSASLCAPPAIQPDMPLPGKPALATRCTAADGCAFCGIATGKAPANVLYQDDQVIAFVDRRSTPKKPHFLVIPKQHVPSLAHTSPSAADEQLVGHLMSVGAQLVATHPELSGMRRGYQTHTNIGGGKGGTGIASVPHLHAHFTMPYKARPNPLKVLFAKAKRSWNKVFHQRAPAADRSPLRAR